MTQATTTSESGEATAAVKSLAIDANAAARLMASARRSYAIAEVVQERRLIGNIDSAVPAHRALTDLLELVVRLHGEPAPDDFTELSVRARAIAAAEHLVPEARGEELAFIHELRARVVEGRGTVTGAEDRRYDRAFVRAAEWFDGVQSYLDEHFPPLEPRWGRRAKWTVGVVFVFALGVLVGRHVRPDGAPIADVPLPASTAVTGALAKTEAAPSLTPLETPVRLLVTDKHVECAGCWPLEGSLEAPYAWTAAKVDLVVRGLIARRRYHVVLDVSDAGHVSRVRFEAPSGEPSSEVSLEKGTATSAAAFTADDDGALHFVVRVDAWKPSEHVKGSADTRELGVALSDVRLEEAPAHDPPADSTGR